MKTMYIWHGLFTRFLSHVIYNENAWECGCENILITENVTVRYTITNIIILHSVYSNFVIIDRNIWFEYIS